MSLKKIFIILENGDKHLLGLSKNLYNWFLQGEERGIIVPFSGNKEYTTIKSIYNKEYDQFVTYISE